LKVVQDLSGTTVTNTKPLTSRLAQTDPAVLKLTGTAPTSVLVKLDYDPLATYAGDIPGLSATTPAAGQKVSVASPAAAAYSGHINSVEQGFVAALRQAVPSAKVERTYHVVYGGLAVQVPANQVGSLLNLPGAVAVQADSLHKLDSVAPVADDDAEFIGANSAYSALGSNATAGKGVIVADVDTGVWPEHPSFAGRSDLPATPPATPDGHTRACNFGTNPLANPPTSTAFACNNKLIGGQVFLNTYNALIGDEFYPTSARDSNGHGTHTTSTAAGNPLAHVPLFGIGRGPIQGIAPGAFVMSYKALGPQGGFDSDLVAAIEQAVADGANVINYSVGPSAPQSPYTSPDDLAFLDAFNAGVFASTSAGNSGPAAASVSHNGPWETSVGASSLQRAFVSTTTLTATGGFTLAVKGSSIMPGITSATPVVLASSLAGYSAGCSTAAPLGSFTGKIVVCVRGGIGRVQKGFNVKAGGAAGMFLVNPVVEDTETDNHFLPAVHFDKPAGDQLIAFVTAHPATTATFTTGQEADGQGDVLAAFSSRGPAGPGGDFLKPDIVAPGVQILAGNTPTPTDIASGPRGQLFQAIAGTSMSAPHITGSAALVFALHPGWSPAQVKSALMTTANRKVVKEDGHTPAGVFDQGAGRVALQGVVDPGLTLDVSAKQMDGVLVDPIHRIDLNEPSVYDSSLPGKVTTKRVFKNIDTQTQVYDVTVTSDLKGAITVSPTRFTILPGKTRTVSITLDGTHGKPGTFYTGQIDLVQEQGGHHLHLPVAFKPISPAAGVVSLTSSCNVTVVHLSNPKDSTCTATAQNTALQPATVNLSTSWATNLVGPSWSPGGVKTGKTVKFPSTVLAAATPPDPKVSTGSSPYGFLDLATFPSLTLQKMGDETLSNFTTPAFTFAGQTYTSLGVASNGYIVVGGGDANDISATPQTFPDPARPNNVLAPLWTDLDGGNGTVAGQGFYIGVLSSGSNSWIAIQWNAHVFGSPTHLETFQVWLGMNGTEDVSYAYDPAHPVTDPGIPFNIGAENAGGTAGSNFSGLPTSDLVVASTPGVPGGSVSFFVKLRPIGLLPNQAPSKVETDMTTSLTRDTSVSISNIQVLP
jgi:subtilisin family serine protease